DFLMQFETSVKGLEMRDFVNGTDTAKQYATDVKFGIILERDIAADPYTGTGTMVAPIYNESLLKKTVLDNAKGLNSGESVNNWSSTTNSSLAQYNYYYTISDYTNYAGSLTDKGRIDTYLKFENTEANRGKVFNVYTYIIYTDPSGSDQVILSTPKVMNMYDIGITEDGINESST
ncbi:MAG: hypothetical protein PUB41_03735, partial [bacterium]|nr:hypothetical protein [bacterium]